MRSIVLGLALLPLAIPARARARTRLVVNFGAGGPSDLMGRLVAPELLAALGAQVVIKNSAGAAGGISAAEVARARPDGSMLLLSPIVARKQRDFASFWLGEWEKSRGIVQATGIRPGAWSIFKPCGFARRLGKCVKTKARAASPSSLTLKRL